MQNIHKLVPRAPRRSIDNEVVEDSEPEREALRQTQKLERKRRKLAAVHSAAMVEKSAPSKVIEISDGSVPASPAASSAGLRHHSRSPINIIDISDSSVNMSEPHIAVNTDVISLHSSIAVAKTTSDATDVDIISLYPQTALAAPASLGHSDDEEIVPTLNLGHFAFTNPRSLQSRHFSSAPGSQCNSDTQTKAPAKTKAGARSSSNPLTSEFSDAELKKLVKCVSCDIAWTARKSAAQKIVHIRSCAKKNGLNDETVRILIRKDLDNAPDDAGPSNRKGPTTSTTLLEDVVREAAPKRKGKRKEIVDALKSVSETRETILGRARMLLGSGTLSDGHSFAVRTQAFIATAPTAPEPTQVFGPSRLGKRQGLNPSLLGDQDSDGEPDLPPATQTYAPSKLGGRPAAASGGWGYESDSGCESPVSASDPAVSPASNPHVSPPSSLKEVSPLFPMRMRGNTSAAALSSPLQGGSENDDDDAYMHFDPEIYKEITLETMNMGQKRQKSPKTAREGRGKKSPKGKKRKTRVLAETLSPTTSKTKRSRKKGEDEYDENWELRLKDRIVKDRDLHLRILRYEPINFEVFLPLATNGEVAGARLKLKLRAFLDKQAINFYGGEMGRTGRR
ncbi:hypothetical protein C8R44DRAFT_80246 [Mycena epipterygia]|nr:hypothetical protein C8R44DRAFT_80246 [Mycena epipterygia]